MPTLEFVVEGPPVGANAKAHSATTRRKYREWMQKVKTAAINKELSSLPLIQSGEVEVRITNFPSGSYHDVDNVIKPIFDAMNGVIYTDDQLITRVLSERIDLSNRPLITNPSDLVIEAIDRYQEFLHIVVIWEE